MRNGSKIFNMNPSVRYRKAALKDHCKSNQHREAITAEHLQRVSPFNKKKTEIKQTEIETLCKSFMSAYWIAKQEIANSKFPSLLQLVEDLGVKELRHFHHKSSMSLREIFISLGQEGSKVLLEKLQQVNCYGVMCDDVTDIAVTEQFICFVQYLDTSTQSAETAFLFVENVLKDSDSASATAMLQILQDKFTEYNLEVKKISGFVSDGASVMTGKRGGLATLLRQINPTLISIHCICHRLALACLDSNKDIHYIGDIELLLRQLWKPLRKNMASGT
ncbi:zinc finger protein 862-like [Ptychodera flava]|uniref:zinc finger protein 862-like n=1 Tax=Ptychodera flava TaxID=63121 RepID=UPI00396AA11E